MRTLAILIALPVLIATATASDGENSEGSSVLDAHVVRAKIIQAVELAGSDPEQSSEDLRTILERTEDQSLRGVAAYDLGVLAHGQGDFDRAIKLYRDSDRASTEPALRADARFNLGHAIYTKAHAGEAPASIDDLDARINELTQSARAFRSVLAVDPSSNDAARNTEIIRREIQQLRQVRDQAQEQNQQREDLANQLNEQAEQQREQADDTQQSPPEDEQSQNDQQRDQQELSDKTEQSSKDLDQADQQQGEKSSASEDIQDAMEAQREAEQAMRDGDQDRAARKQNEAADKLKQAAEKLQQETDETQHGEKGSQEDAQKSDEKSEQNEGQESDQPGESEGEQEGEIDQLAKDLLDKERRERERRTYRTKGRPVRVEKDW